MLLSLTGLKFQGSVSFRDSRRGYLVTRLNTATVLLSCVHVSNPTNVNMEATFLSETSISIHMTTEFTSQNCNAVL